MDINSIIASIDAEIEKLNQARSMLSSGTSSISTVKPVRTPKPPVAPKRVLSPDARKRIADAQRKRWAAVKKLKKAAKAVVPAKVAKKASTKVAPPKATKKATLKKQKPAPPRKAAAKKPSPAKTEAPKTDIVPF